MKRPLGVKLFGSLSVLWGLAVVLLTSQMVRLLVHKSGVPSPSVLCVILVGGGWLGVPVGLGY